MVVGLKRIYAVTYYLVYLLITLVIIVTKVKHHLLLGRQQCYGLL